MQEKTSLLTEHQKTKLAKDSAVYDYYNKLIDQGAKKTVAIDMCMKQHRLYTITTVYRILKRESKRRDEK
jgi:hypothetical protein